MQNAEKNKAKKIMTFHSSIDLDYLLELVLSEKYPGIMTNRKTGAPLSKDDALIGILELKKQGYKALAVGNCDAIRKDGSCKGHKVKGGRFA